MTQSRSHRRSGGGFLYRGILAASVALAAGLLAGCPPAPPTTQVAALQESSGPAPIVGSEPTAASAGVFMPLPDRTVRQGDALAKALRSLNDIGLEVRKSATTAAASAPVAMPAATEPHEPPPLAVKRYLQGREKFLEGAYTEALTYLEQALNLDPQSFTILKLMGRVYFASEQLASGSLYLQRAAAIDPTDVEVNYLLGRYWLERKEYPSAINYLLTAEQSPKRDREEILTPLTSFFLARALQQAGYHLAAAQEYQTFISVAAQPVAGYRYDRDLNMILEQDWAVHLAAAENYYVVGKWAQARAEYEAALSKDAKDAYIESRLITAEVHLGQGDLAASRAQDLLAETQGSDDAVTLLSWTYRQLGREYRMLPDYKARVAATGDGGGKSILALASLQERQGQKDAALQTLTEYQRANPKDDAALRRLVTLAMDTHHLDAGFAAVVRSLAAQPDRTADMREQLARLAGDKPDAATLAIFEKSPAENGTAAQRAMLLGVVAQAVQQDDTAQKYFEAAVAADGNFWPAREAYLNLLLSREKFGRAQELVQQAIDSNQGGARAYLLDLDSEVAQYRYANALKQARKAKDQFPDNLEVRLDLIRILRLRGEQRQAANELSFVLDRFPTDPRGYEQMIDTQLTLGSREQALDTLARMLRQLPDNPFALKLAARFLSSQRNTAEAQQMLDRVLKQSPDDEEALVLLAQVRLAEQHSDAAVDLLKSALDRQKDHPSVTLFIGLNAIYDDLDAKDDAAALALKMVKLRPDSEELTVAAAAALMRLDRKNDADGLMQSAVEKFPRSQPAALLYASFLAQNDRSADAAAVMQKYIDRNGATAERLYRLSSFQEAAGQFDACVATLRRVLEIMPDHVGANNDLGYYWADRGEHLPEAQAMISRALENEPNNAAFLDSLGWAYYKQGNFAEAVAQLKKAISLPDGEDPELLSHLGDALWRSGQKAEATRNWQQANGMLLDSPSALRDKTKQYVAKVLRQVQNRQDPDVRPLAPTASTAPASTTTASRNE